jgi:hypothetical protein
MILLNCGCIIRSFLFLQQEVEADRFMGNFFGAVAFTPDLIAGQLPGEAQA